MPAKNNTRRSKNHANKPRLDQELVDDQKFQQKLEAERFTARIEREANEAAMCFNCGDSAAEEFSDAERPFNI